ncbi:MAG: D-tyrosyl-tRNA(Tyr) deacylase [Cyclobacteriaceae bacterium]|nr:D-tyrosyl-tRNA(Tyr) deacylase [Cyclobacteriaceae bacterium SS2]
MIAVVQRVSRASVSISGIIKAQITSGLLILLGIEEEDNQEDISWLAQKLVNLRIFSDDEDKMNLSVKDIQGETLIVSQFTLHASTKKGNRPSFIKAARPETAIPLYEEFITAVSSHGVPVKTGEFGANMQIDLLNDGPVTLIIDTKNKV